MLGRGAMVFMTAWVVPLLGCSSGESDPCTYQGCSSRGFCVDDGAPYCACMHGYRPVGLTCVRVAASDPCEGIDCNGHGSCRVVADDPTCDCVAGYRHVTDPLCEGTECDLLCIPIRASDEDAVDAPADEPEDLVDAPADEPEDLVDESSLLPCEATYSYPTMFCDGAERFVYGNAVSAEAFCRSEGFETGYQAAGHRTDAAVCVWNGTSWSAYDSEENPAVGRATCTRSAPCAP